MIEAIAVRRVFSNRRGDVVALDAVDLSVAAGEFVSVLGQSGCGKSTLLHVLGGFVPATSGEVRVDGVTVAGPDRARGIVFQEPALFPWRTVLGNVTFGLEQLGVPRRDRLARARRMIELVHLSGVERQYPKTLSGGMKQRVALARALVTDPAVLLMDEPFGALDAQTRSRLQDELVAIWRRTAKSIVFVTHSVDEALYLSDVVYVLSPRPATVRARVAVDLDRPRDREELIGSARYAELHRQLTALVTG
jgi:NitT/TauT family transport system ATP-binding protein